MQLPLMDDIQNRPVYYLSRLVLLTIGSLISAFSVVVFLLPASIAPSGITGLAVILRELFNTPIGPVILVANIPIQLIAFRVLKGWRTVLFTLYTVVFYSLTIEVMQSVFGDVSLTDDAFLSAVVGGVIGGIGGGLIYRAGGTVGGTSTVAQMLRHKFGLPLSTASLFGDTLIICLAGIVLGWEAALYAFITVFVNRIASDYVLEGPSDICTAIIVTDFPDQLSEAVAERLEHDSTSWNVQGNYTTETHQVVMISILRSEVHELQHLVRDIDNSAFMTVLMGQTVYGGSFKPMYSQMPLWLDEVET